MPIPDDLQTSDASAPVCRCDGAALELVSKTPRVGPYPELKTFRCSRCGEVVTVEAG